jgi:predicted nucleic-acid-binding protein
VIGLDTDILVRYITDDDPKWSSIARQFIDSKCTLNTPGFVHPLVLAEVVWAIKNHGGYNKQKTINLIREFLDADNLVIGNAHQVELALENYRASSAGFTDCLIATLNDEVGATPTYSIDKDAIKSAIFAAID